MEQANATCVLGGSTVDTATRALRGIGDPSLVWGSVYAYVDAAATATTTAPPSSFLAAASASDSAAALVMDLASSTQMTSLGSLAARHLRALNAGEQPPLLAAAAAAAALGTPSGTDVDSCAACCTTLSAMLCIGNVPFNIFRMVLAACLLLSLIYLAVRVGRSYFALLESGTRSPNAWTLDPSAPIHSVVPLFNSYSLAVCFMLGVQAMSMFAPQDSPIAYVAYFMLYLVHGFLDNAIIVLGFIEDFSMKKLWGVFFVSITVSVLKVTIVTAMTYSLCDLEDCIPVYTLYPQIAWEFFLFAIIYSLLFVPLLWRHGPVNLRSSLGWWVALMASSNILYFIGISLWNYGIDFGLCVLLFSNLVYTIIYTPLLFHTFLKESNHIRHKEDSHPLLETASMNYSRDNVIALAKKLLPEFPSIHWVDLNDIKKGKRIGRGSSGTVFKGSWNGTPVAVKRITDKGKREAQLREFFREIRVMCKLSHPNILLFLGIAIDTKGDLYIITEHMAKGSVYDVMHPTLRKISGNNSRPSTPFSTSSVSSISSTSSTGLESILPTASDIMTGQRGLSILKQTAAGMAYLHSRTPPILHRDLKSHNILLDEHWNAKIADFGLSRPQSVHTMTAAGTPQWLAPEVIRQERYTEKADVYSFGIFIWECVTAEIPYYGMSPFSAAHAVAYSALRPKCEPHHPAGYTALAKKCWTEIPNDRPTFLEILEELEKLEPYPTPPVLLARLEKLQQQQAEVSLRRSQTIEELLRQEQGELPGDLPAAVHAAIGESDINVDTDAFAIEIADPGNVINQ